MFEKGKKMFKEINGVLHIDGCSVEDLANEYGTPLYVYSENEIISRFNEIKKAFLKYPKYRIAYACKAFCSLAMIRLCEREGVCIDVVSGGELYAAIKAEFPPNRIEFNGNNKLKNEIEMAIDYGVGRIIIDSLQELDVIEEICRKNNKKMNVLYRVNPSVKVDTHDYIITGKKDSKFGIPTEEDVFYPEIERAIKSDHVNFLGFHFHIGSQLFEVEPYLKAVDIVIELIKEVKDRFDFLVSEINIGGGFGVIYTDEERKPYGYYLTPIINRIKSFYNNMGYDLPSIVVEPGRSIVSEAGISIYEIGSIKEIRGVRKYVSIDGGMTDNIRPALYGSNYRGIVANRCGEKKDNLVTISGKCCESGDIIIKDATVPKETKGGDYYVIFSTGAYGYSMASNYNNNPIPAVVFVKDGLSSLVVKRQSYEDIIKNNIIPEYLK